jgi:Tfp pilus assembly PilM family ATPase
MRLRSGTLTLPLGVDIGATRVRVALVHRMPEGNVELVAVATRDHRSDPLPALADAIAELQTRERRCIFSVHEPQGLLRGVRFPPMRRGEQERAARYEAVKHIDYAIEDAAVRIVGAAGGESVLGVVRKDVVGSLVDAAHAAKLRVMAVDNVAYAYARAVPGTDAVLDVGSTESRLYVFTSTVPVERRISIGGHAFTDAVARALGCDDATARRRKEAFGIAGCADNELSLIAGEVAGALVDCRVDGIGDVRSIALTGNGSRLTDLPERLERATAVRVRRVALEPSVSQTLPRDVLRAAAPDWCLAYGLALWSAA